MIYCADYYVFDNNFLSCLLRLTCGAFLPAMQRQVAARAAGGNIPINHDDHTLCFIWSVPSLSIQCVCAFLQCWPSWSWGLHREPMSLDKGVFYDSTHI